MKILLHILLTSVLCSASRAEFRVWTRSDGKTADLDLVSVTESSGEKIGVEAKMPWPQLKLSKTEKFKKEFKHPGGGIPNLVLTDLDGKLIKTSYEGKDYVGPTVVMDHLKTLLHQ